jgi:hypothetical protein
MAKAIFEIDTKVVAEYGAFQKHYGCLRSVEIVVVIDRNSADCCLLGLWTTEAECRSPSASFFIGDAPNSPCFGHLGFRQEMQANR